MNSEVMSNFFDLIEEYEKSVKSELLDRWNSLVINATQQSLYEVLFGIVSNQLGITIYFLRSPHSWNYAVAPILFRTISEHFINMQWIIKEDSLNRAKMFIAYGLGQEKLTIEHFKAKAIAKDDEQLRKQVLDVERMLNQERYTALTDVNLGSWSSKSVRSIAEESGEEEFYHFAYSPYSHATHGTWNHIYKISLQHSLNPLHKNIRQPVFHDYSPNVHLAIQSMEYMQQTYDALDRYTGYIYDVNKAAIAMFKQSLDKLEEDKL